MQSLSLPRFFAPPRALERLACSKTNAHSPPQLTSVKLEPTARRACLCPFPSHTRVPLGMPSLAPPSAVIIVFVKPPLPGKAKTRLSAGVGAEAAVAFYRECAERTIRAACR